MKRILEVVKLSSPPRKNWLKVNNKLFTASMVARFEKIYIEIFCFLTNIAANLI